MKPLKLNAPQLACLRRAARNPTGRIKTGDLGVSKALVKRGYAIEVDCQGRAVFSLERGKVVFEQVDDDRCHLGDPFGPFDFFITVAGRERAKFKADSWGNMGYSGPRDQSLMEDM
jgi:hypothetical protein